MNGVQKDINTITLPDGELVVTQAYSTNPQKPEMTVTLRSTGRELQLDAPRERLPNIRYYEQIDAIRESLDGFRHHHDLGVTEVLTPDPHTLVLKSNALNSEEHTLDAVYKHNYRLGGSDLKNFTSDMEKHLTGQHFAIKTTPRDGDPDQLDVVLFSQNGQIIVEIHTRPDIKQTEDKVLKSSFALMNEQDHEAKRKNAMSIVDRLLPKLHERLPEVSFSEINLKNFNNEKMVLNVAAHDHVAEVFSTLAGQLQSMRDKGVVAGNERGPKSLALDFMERREQIARRGSLVTPQLEEEVAAILHRHLGEEDTARRRTIREEIMSAVKGQRGQGGGIE